jgi:hypothetical protein
MDISDILWFCDRALTTREIRNCITHVTGATMVKLQIETVNVTCAGDALWEKNVGMSDTLCGSISHLLDDFDEPGPGELYLLSEEESADTYGPLWRK